MESAFRTIKVSDSRFERDGLRYVTVKSPALKQRGDIVLFVPEGATEGADLPLVTLLHGVYCSCWSWAYFAGAHLTAARLIKEGEIPPMVLAMPSDGLWGDGSAYVQHAEQDFEEWVVRDVPRAAIEATGVVSASSVQFLGGLSMGGFGTLRLGARNGGQYRAISAHSSITKIEQFAEFVEEDLASYCVEEPAPSALEAILTHRHSLPGLRIDCGVDDVLIEHNRELHRELEEAGIDHLYEEFPGIHEWAYWEEHLVDTLRFFAAQI